MTPFPLLCLLAALAAEPDPTSMVTKLGSARYSEREAAAEALKRLGAEARPALREARRAADPEVRTRAAHVLDEIERDLVLRPPLIRLDFRDRTLAEVIEEIGARGGTMPVPDDRFAMSRMAEARPTWPDRRITLEASEPVPFWEAIDRLCRAGGLRRNYPANAFGPDVGFNRLVLVPGTAPTPPTSDSGAFRVELLRICDERDLDLAPGLDDPMRQSSPIGPRVAPGTDRVRAASFFAEVLVSVDPRLRIMGQPALEHLEAVDDQGRSLLQEPTDAERRQQLELWRMNPHLDPRLHPELRFSSMNGPSSPYRLERVPLSDPDRPGRRVARFRGVAAVAVVARRPDRLVVPLAGASGKTFEKEGTKIVVHRVELRPSYFNPDLDLTLETDGPGQSLTIQGRGIKPVAIRTPNDLLNQQIEILDDQGQLIPWSFTKSPSEGTRGRMSLQIGGSRNRPIDPDTLRLRFHNVVGAAAEVPFVFDDISLP